MKNKVELNEFILTLTNTERRVIPEICKDSNLEDLEEKTSISKETLKTILMLLETKGITNTWHDERDLVLLDKLGLKFINSDLPEIIFLKEIKNKSKKKSELNIDNETFSSAIGILKKNSLIEIKKEDELIFQINKNGLNFLENNSENPLKIFKDGLNLEDLLNKKEIVEIYNNLKIRRGFLRKKKIKEFNFSLTDFGMEIKNYLLENKQLIYLDLEEKLTPEMLKDSSYKNKKFRYYDIGVKTSLSDFGRRHPMHEANEKISEVFIEMGFSEMRGPLVESAFWNMDVLWIPQDHPARDEQDTFYLDSQADIPLELKDKIKKMHEEGIKRTHTLKGEWKVEISRKRLLRTHSTPTSFRLLHELSKLLKKGEKINGKYFYSANNFRNEAIDATHLAEFFQTEGFIIGDDLSLADLMGFIREFYLKFGIDKIKFKPTFNPYTEPSMEAHYYDKKLKKWYALVNSGIFRPETLKPFGLENKTIIAWGVGASRVATLLTGAKSMREITGHTCDFDFLKKRPLMKREIIRED